MGKIRETWAKALAARRRSGAASAADVSADAAVGVSEAAPQRAVALTRLGLLVEGIARAFWPFLSVLAFVFAALAFRLPDVLPDAALWVLWVVAGAGLLVSFGFGLWRFRWPTRAAAVARLDATLPGRPLTALSDRMAMGETDPATMALWQAHRVRMERLAATARPVRPDPDLARRDPYALRLTALTAVAVALLFGAPLAVLSPAPPPGLTGPAQAAQGPSWEGWAAPPRYTGKPGIYLNKLDGDTLSVPKGTRFVFRFYGRPGSVPFAETVSNPAAEPVVAKPAQADAGAQSTERSFDAMHDGAITVGGPAGRAIKIAILADHAPEVALLAPAERRADGKFAQSFKATDDYGVVRGQAHISLDLAKVTRRYGLTIAPEARPDMVFDLPMPISGSRADFTEQLVEDASKSAWANLPVTLSLTVEDGLGQTGTTGPQEIVLPGKRFFDPRAAALIEVRQDLLWSRANAPREAQILRAIANRPDDIFPKPEMAATVQTIALKLDEPDLTPEARDDLGEMLWQLAAILEDGGLGDALAAMQKAQQKLSEAIRNGASKDEIAKLTQDLKDATDRYLQMLAQRSQDQGSQFGQSRGDERVVTQDQIQQMMDAIKKAMEEGRMADAQQMLDQLSRMMQNMKVTQGQGASGQGAPSPGEQSMQDLQDLLRQQQGLSDQVFRDLQKEAQGDSDQGGGNPSGNAPGKAPGNAPGTDQNGNGQNGPGASGSAPGDLAQNQGDLRHDLDQQRGLLPNVDPETGKDIQRRLEDAGRAMDQARGALEQGDKGEAIGRQAEAIQSLREGIRSLGEALRKQQEQQGQGPDGQQPGGQKGAQGQPRGGDTTGGTGSRGAARDPLGRLPGDGQQASGQNDMLPDDDVYGRARALLDELRRRSADRQRSPEELDYLGRLLDRF